MTILIYNTLTRKKEIFRPINPSKVKIYVCGPTVYDACHIGHARSAVFFDVIVQYFRVIGFEVTYVRNFTDVDDKIINRSKELGLTWHKLSRIYIDEFHNDMKMLNVTPANFEPCVTDCITDVINIIELLVKNRSAYVKKGDVYFAVDSFNSYGKLSGRNKKDMIAGSRIKINENKENPLDFTLWKNGKTGEPSWESPWGYGRPGWHIECSAMNRKILGQTIDIHGGGEDLVFPHHENEIAQSESAYRVPLAHYWMHNGLVNINNEKMSKSLGNWKSIKDITKSYQPETVRLFLLSSHYRTPIDFSQQSLESCKKALTKIYRILQKTIALMKIEHKSTNSGSKLWKDFCIAMNDDFNTAKSIGILFATIRKINKTIATIRDKRKYEHNTAVIDTINDILLIGRILGIINLSPKHHSTLKTQSAIHKEKNLDLILIESLIKERKEARRTKNWAKADQIRNRLNDMGVQVEDKNDGTTWKFIS